MDAPDKGELFFGTTSKLTMGPTEPPIQAVSLVVKWSSHLMRLRIVVLGTDKTLPSLTLPSKYWLPTLWLRVSIQLDCVGREVT